MVEEIAYRVSYEAYWAPSALGMTSVTLETRGTETLGTLFEKGVTTLPCPLTSRRKSLRTS